LKKKKAQAVQRFESPTYRVRSLSTSKYKILKTRQVQIDGKIRTPSREYFFQPNEAQPVDSLADYEVLLAIGHIQNACCGQGQIEKRLLHVQNILNECKETYFKRIIGVCK